MTDDNQEQAEADRPPQETVSFTFDRTVARFRETFPNARWSDRLQAWTVPGKTARKRIERWLALEAQRQTPYEEERGRDAFEFEPILSPYLQVFGSGFRIRTPYSRTVVDELRQVPFARWNGDDKVWGIPFASYDDLQHRWETIEEAAKRSEPEERRKRAEARRGTEEEAKAKRRTTERKKRRLPVSSDDLPPLGRPVATAAYGIVVITDVSGEVVDDVAGVLMGSDRVPPQRPRPTLDQAIQSTRETVLCGQLGVHGVSAEIAVQQNYLTPSLRLGALNNLLLCNRAERLFDLGGRFTNALGRRR